MVWKLNLIGQLQLNQPPKIDRGQRTRMYNILNS